MTGQRALWVSTSTTTRGGVATFVRTIRQTRLWTDWEIRHIVTHRDGSIAMRLSAFATGAAGFVVALVFHRPDVVHLHTASYGSFARKAILAWIARAARIPVVLHVHGAEFHSFFRRSPGIVQWAIRTTLTHASAVVALGSGWADRLEAIAPGARIIIVPNAVRPHTAVTQPTEAEPVHAVFLGEIGDRKGTFLLLDAWAKLLADGLDRAGIRLTIAGDGELRRARGRVAELALNDSVNVLGWIGSDAVDDLLETAQVLVLPSRNEGQPMAVLEAMARGLCVVACDVGGIPDLIDDSCGVLVPAGEVDALVSALRRVLCDHDKRRTLGSAALRRVEADFDVEVVSRRFDAIYRQVRR
ncbi:glycosyltransferase family 4 protein [Rhodococcus opacus]|uniref:Putative glycosyltransferase n=1 Tax=Rhodococcus opacus (strain B4) TaxID=632772 RepID=C1AY51_RHOOB|nr:glycosyltransferase family 4 protein [Rhodococcus opacus]BAH54046.1 putative glycosyltransferase [Rhodococcus opacus B4]